MKNNDTWNLDAGLRRTFPIHEDLEFVFEVDSIDVWNHVTFNNPDASWASGSLPLALSLAFPGNPGPRDFQFAGHINF